jgi:four helix bundle protein
MSTIVSYRDLDAWKSGMDLLLSVYRVASQLPPTERFELAGQMRRAAVSVPSNIAEGQATGPGGRYRHHVRIALGSLAELDTHVEAIRRLGYVAEEALGDLTNRLAHTGRIIHGLHRSLRRRQLTLGAIVLLPIFWFSAMLLIL